MALTLSAKEHQMLTAVIQEMNEIPAVDFKVIASKTGQKYAKNARSAFKKVWDKLKAHSADEGVQGAGSGGEDAAADALKLKAKPGPKKGVGQRKAPAKAANISRKTRQKTKKEKEADAKAEIKPEAEAEADTDEEVEDEIEGVAATDGEMDGEPVGGDGTNASRATSPDMVYQEDQENDEIGASMLGISIEEFRHLAQETLWIRRAPTPKGYVGSDDEA